MKVMDFFFEQLIQIPRMYSALEIQISWPWWFICQNTKGKFSHASSSFQLKMGVVLRVLYALVLINPYRTNVENRVSS